MYEKNKQKKKQFNINLPTIKNSKLTPFLSQSHFGYSLVRREKTPHEECRFVHSVQEVIYTNLRPFPLKRAETDFPDLNDRQPCPDIN